MEQRKEDAKPNREQWLNVMKEELRPLFLIAGLEIPKVRISCGFSGKNVRGSRNGRVLGVAYNHIVSSDDTCEIFISPEIADSLQVAAVLVHELIHTRIQGHGKDFKKIAVELGLMGKMTSTIATPDLNARLASLIDKIGQEYPHAKMNLADRPKQETRLRKVQCVNPDCKAIVYMVDKWIDSIGTPYCSCGCRDQMQVCTERA